VNTDDQSKVRSRTGSLSNPERWVDEYGELLFRYALARLRDPAKAEDVVQEAFLAALKGGQTFQGRGAEKSWLVGILKHKIMDHFRRAGRETSFTDLNFYQNQEETEFEPTGAAAGHWAQAAIPSEWEQPGASLDSEVFWQTLRQCTEKLPASVATVFTLREVDGVSGKEICSSLNITENNLWVMLHRARMALRRCLEVNWFRRPPAAD